MSAASRFMDDRWLCAHMCLHTCICMYPSERQSLSDVEHIFLLKTLLKIFSVVGELLGSLRKLSQNPPLPFRTLVLKVVGLPHDMNKSS